MPVQEALKTQTPKRSQGVFYDRRSMQVLDGKNNVTRDTHVWYERSAKMAVLKYASRYCNGSVETAIRAGGLQYVENLWEADFTVLIPKHGSWEAVEPLYLKLIYPEENTRVGHQDRHILLCTKRGRRNNDPFATS